MGIASPAHSSLQPIRIVSQIWEVTEWKHNYQYRFTDLTSPVITVCR